MTEKCSHRPHEKDIMHRQEEFIITNWELSEQNVVNVRNCIYLWRQLIKNNNCFLFYHEGEIKI